MSLRAGVNVPFNKMDLDLGWQRTYVEGEDVAGGARFKCIAPSEGVAYIVKTLSI